MPSIDRAAILIVATDGFEQLELMTPEAEFLQRGAAVDIATLKGEPIRGWNEDEWGETVEADLAVSGARADDYDALVLPGGRLNPDLLREDETTIALVRAFHEQGRVIGAVCHAPWLLIEAGLARGREMTSYPSLRTDLTNAGARWVDREVVVDDRIVTSRGPKDLQAFVAGIAEEIERLGDNRSAA